MIDNVSGIIGNITVAMLPDPDIIHIISDIVKTDIHRYLDRIPVCILHVLGNRYHPRIVIHKQGFYMRFCDI